MASLAVLHVGGGALFLGHQIPLVGIQRSSESGVSALRNVPTLCVGRYYHYYYYYTTVESRAVYTSLGTDTLSADIISVLETPENINQLVPPST